MRLIQQKNKDLRYVKIRFIQCLYLHKDYQLSIYAFASFLSYLIIIDPEFV